ncbi:MAG: diadenylate cyclase CdaA [Oligoflexales bacterium]
MWIIEQIDRWAILDILLIAILIYHVLLLIRGTRSAQILTGIGFVTLTFLLSSILPLTTLHWLINKFSSSLMLIIVILFQDDIRDALSRIGQKPLISGSETVSSNQLLDEITRVTLSLAAQKVGALIVLERNIILNRYVDIGVLVDARISRELLMAIFHPTSPIHDGAIIIQQGRVSAAGCFLPLTRDPNLGNHMGTRHRAAIGMSQETDAVVLLVSEETGEYSIVVDGTVFTKNSATELKKSLHRHLIDEPEYATVDTARPTQSEKILERIRKQWIGK